MIYKDNVIDLGAHHWRTLEEINGYYG